MKEEEIVDCVIEIDQLLADIEAAIARKDYPKAVHKVKEARGAIEELREDDEIEIDYDIEMDMMDRLK